LHELLGESPINSSPTQLAESPKKKQYHVSSSSPEVPAKTPCRKNPNTECLKIKSAYLKRKEEERHTRKERVQKYFSDGLKLKQDREKLDLEKKIQFKIIVNCTSSYFRIYSICFHLLYRIESEFQSSILFVGYSCIARRGI
jgi:hypothetical protein